MGAAQLPVVVRESVTVVDRIVRASLGGRGVSTYVHGSLALGGFNPLRSDVDVLVVIADHRPLETAVLRHLGGRLATVANVPGGLELSIVTESAARQPSAPWPFVLYVTTAPTDTEFVIGVDRVGDPDLLMHYVVPLAAGIVVFGQPPALTIGPIERAAVLRYLADELTWAETSAGEAYGVLNAARARCFLHDGLIVSKIDGGRRALAEHGPQELLTSALKAQAGDADERPLTDPGLRYMRAVLRELTEAAAG